MSAAPKIVAIARDAALLHSLAFMLRAHGLDVVAFDSWNAAKPSTETASCVILDGFLPRADRLACFANLPSGTDLILLAEGQAPIPARDRLTVVHKPLSGPDIMKAVAALRMNT